MFSQKREILCWRLKQKWKESENSIFIIIVNYFVRKIDIAILQRYILVLSLHKHNERRGPKKKIFNFHSFFSTNFSIAYFWVYLYHSKVCVFAVLWRSHDCFFDLCCPHSQLMCGYVDDFFLYVYINKSAEITWVEKNKKYRFSSKEF